MSLISCFAGIAVALPYSFDSEISKVVITLIGISFSTAGAAAINMFYDSDIDALMPRTKNRAIPIGAVNRDFALLSGILLSSISVGLMYFMVNILSSALLLCAVLYYVVFYTMYLKRKTFHSTEIGGICGCIPPLVGYSAMSYDLSMQAWMIFFLIFFWSPPHFWVLSITNAVYYEKVNIPMLYSVMGEKITKLYILSYTFCMIYVSILMFIKIESLSLLYLIISSISNIIFLYFFIGIFINNKHSRKAFFWSIAYMFIILTTVIIDSII
ncbi:MAG: protoheme IX farnesyltransferase [Candidatus Xenolissoclinum pacificiensis L6]|uniref:Protoheme IX farnesyltransferase n=1 Tax=Candidatus Xenolissoclinum pacificiensis L6 TaxID=1401685 RepID=W2V1E5_9RICK|nr:MAG: protoheme IX farnesyltransferase [Candidatus Xenolissoclinum pacificiensis L6]